MRHHLSQTHSLSLSINGDLTWSKLVSIWHTCNNGNTCIYYGNSMFIFVATKFSSPLQGMCKHQIWNVQSFHSPQTIGGGGGENPSIVSFFSFLRDRLVKWAFSLFNLLANWLRTPPIIRKCIANLYGILIIVVPRWLSVSIGRLIVCINYASHFFLYQRKQIILPHVGNLHATLKTSKTMPMARMSQFSKMNKIKTAMFAPLTTILSKAIAFTHNNGHSTVPTNVCCHDNHH